MPVFKNMKYSYSLLTKENLDRAGVLISFQAIPEMKFNYAYVIERVGGVRDCNHNVGTERIDERIRLYPLNCHCKSAHGFCLVFTMRYVQTARSSTCFVFFAGPGNTVSQYPLFCHESKSG